MPEGQCTWRGTWQLSITDPKIARVAVQVILVPGQYHSRLQIAVSLHESSDYCQGRPRLGVRA